jgi:hypothetical protein
MGYAARNSGPPQWFVFLIGVALVFGVYYVWLGVRDFLEEGIRVPLNPTEQAIVDATATVVSLGEALFSDLPTRRPTSTPRPPCEYYRTTTNAFIRAQPSTAADALQRVERGAVICVVELVEDTDWYLIDRDTDTRATESGYIRMDLVEQLGGTPTFTPTIALGATITATSTPTATPSWTPGPSLTPTYTPIIPTPTPTPTPTPLSINA